MGNPIAGGWKQRKSLDENLFKFSDAPEVVIQYILFNQSNVNFYSATIETNIKGACDKWNYDSKHVSFQFALKAL